MTVKCVGGVYRQFYERKRERERERERVQERERENKYKAIIIWNALQICKLYFAGGCTNGNYDFILYFFVFF